MGGTISHGRSTQGKSADGAWKTQQRWRKAGGPIDRDSCVTLCTKRRSLEAGGYSSRWSLKPGFTVKRN